MPLVSGRITQQSGKWGLNRVNFPKTHASNENELAPMLENRWAKDVYNFRFHGEC